MSDTHRVVRLLKNRLYPTYQLFAVMANRKTRAKDGLRLGALTAMEWLRQRLGENVPDELRRPGPDRYREVGDESLISLHLNRGFVIDIVSLPEQGIWSLQVTEPDLGSNPGLPDQSRNAVPGRVIETNVSFTVHGAELECGFQTVISDPNGTEPEAEIYRLAIIRRLIDTPDFGLEQVTPLTMSPTEIGSVTQFKQFLPVLKSEENQLPCVIFTHLHEEPKESGDSANPVEKFPLPPGTESYRPPFLMPQKSPVVPGSVVPGPGLAAKAAGNPGHQKKAPHKVVLPNYDIDDFAEKNASFCRTYLLADSLFEQLVSTLNLSAQHGDIIVVEPARFGGKKRAIPYKPSKIRQEETMQCLSSEMHAYSQGKNISFGKTRFLSAARESLFQVTSSALQQSEAVSLEWQQKLAMKEAYNADLLRKAKEDNISLASQLERQKAYQTDLESDLSDLRKELALQAEKDKLQLQERDAQIVYLKRKIGQPKVHTDIVGWVGLVFQDRLIMHDRTADTLSDRSAKSVDIGLICDALDFLATDYWDCRYQYIDKSEMHRRCSEKYGRHFEIKPVGDTTIAFSPMQYHVKYAWSGSPRELDSPLDFHLCVGSDPENLLRIYFFHDDERRKIVIGSLPGHLKCVGVK